MDAGTKTALGNAIWERAKLLGYHNQEELAAASVVARRTIGPLIAGTFENQPSVKTLNGLELALACPPGTLVRAYQLGDTRLIEEQPLAGTADPAAWLMERLGTRGATTDPGWIEYMSERLAATLPEVAQILAVLAEVVTEGCGSSSAARAKLSDASQTPSDFASRARRRRPAGHVQPPLMAQAAAG